MPAFPLPLGIGSFGGEDPDTYYRLFKTMQGEGGYPDDDDSNRCKELRAWATIAAICSAAIKRASEQSWPTWATELLDEWEAQYSLSDNAERTTLQRQQRMRAIRTATSRIDDVEDAALGIGAPLGDLISNTRIHVEKDDAEPDTIFQMVMELDTAEYDSPVIRESMIDVMRHSLPARSKSHLDSKSFRDTVVDQDRARWNTDRLDRSAIGRQTANQRDHVRHPSRLKSFGPLSKLKSADFNAIQDALLWGRPGQTDAGGMWMAFHTVATIAPDTVLIDNVDWRDRMAIVAVRWSTDNILPGGVDEADYNTSSELITPVWWGSGGSATGYELTIAGNLILYVDVVNGLLFVKNTTGSLQYIAGMVIGTPDV